MRLVHKLGLFTLLCSLCLKTVPAQSLDVQASASSTQEQSCSAVVRQATHEEQCSYARAHCSEGSWLPYVTLYFCHATSFGWLGAGTFLAVCIFWLVLLFCLLGSTSEQFFSPILSQISEEMGLPPRFAGVTLLALGNGAPDLSACIAAVSSGRYQLALGALLGGAMFVGCVVAGSVIMATGSVPARGALMRDMASLAIAVTSIGLVLASGAVSWLRAGIFLALYTTYVLVVLAADLLHRHQWRPWHAWQSDEESKDLQASLLPAPDRNAAVQTVPSPWASEAGDALSHQLSGDEVTDRSASNSSIEMQRPNSSGRRIPGHDVTADTEGAWSLRRLSDQLQRPTTLLHPAGLVIRPSGSGHSGASQAGRVLAHYAEERGRGSPPLSGRLPSIADEEASPIGLPWADFQLLPPGACGLQQQHSQQAQHHHSHHPQHHDSPPAQQLSGHDVEHQRIAESATGNSGIGEESQAQDAGIHSMPAYLQAALRPAMVAFRAASSILSIAEAPFWVLRRATIPLLEAECYSRPWFILSVICAPLAALVYLRHLTIAWAGSMLAVGCAGALVLAFVTREDPQVAPPLRLGTSLPVGAAIIAAFGFIIAAMWIDTVASEVVALLDLLGTVSGIDHTVLGLTILAWGNSLGDLSTNIVMARRGLANMAMTACYAGPMFSMLVGLGVGFMLLLARQPVSTAAVSLSPMMLAGVGFLLLTSLSMITTGVLCKAHLPARFGFVLIFLYVMYLATSLSLALGN